MPNFFFFSLQDDLEIKYLKISIKFDNNGEGKARFSFKMWIEKETVEKIPELYLFISNKENPIGLEKVEGEDYNLQLIEDKFEKAAGIEDIGKENREHSRGYVLEPITKFEEDPSLEGRKLLIPKKLSVEETYPTEFSEEIALHITKDKDVLLKIEPKLTSEEVKKVAKEDIMIGFQFRIFLTDFLTNETLNSWSSSLDPWSVNIDISKKRNFEDIFHYFKNYLLSPENLDVWINIPHGHLFVASSPVYKNARKLEKEDIQYKTYEEKGKKEYYQKFETKEGDYSVRMGYGKDKEKPEEFSIICMSPFLSGEAPGELKKDISEFMKRSENIETGIEERAETIREEFKREYEKFVRWEDIMVALVLVLAVLSIIFSFPLYKENPSELSNTILVRAQLIMKSVIFGIVLWAVWITCEKIAEIFRRRVKIGKIMLLFIIIVFSYLLLKFAPI